MSPVIEKISALYRGSAQPLAVKPNILPLVIPIVPDIKGFRKGFRDVSKRGHGEVMPCLPSQEKLPLKNQQAREEPLERNADGALLITQTKCNLKRDVDLEDGVGDAVQ